MQATYTFPVGVTTLWWYAPSTSLNASEEQEQEEGKKQGSEVPDGAKQKPFTAWAHADVNGERQQPVEVFFQ